MSLAHEARSTAASGWPFDLGMFSIRLGLGAVFMYHGAQKMFGWFGGHGLGAMIENFGPVLGVLVSVGEFFGGLGMLLGVLTRFSGVSLTVIMLGAIIMVHAKNGFAVSAGGFEFNLALLTMALSVALIGPGRLALGSVLPERFRPWCE